MKFNRLTAAVVLMATTSAFAQPMAQLKKVEGNVLVSTAQGAVAGVNDLAVPDKTLVTTTSNGYVNVVTPKGCTISLTPNQRLEVDVDKSCDALALLVTAAPGAVGLGAAGVGGAGAFGVGGTTLALIGTAALGAAAFARVNRNSSPN